MKRIFIEMYKIPVIARAGLIVWMLLPSVAVCGAPGKAGVVEPGDVADIRFLCRLHTGEIVAASDKAAGQRKELLKSSVFLPRDKNGPISVTAKGLPTEQADYKDMSFEEEIIDGLAGAVAGMKEGDERRIDLSEQERLERGKEDYVIKIARVRERPKEMSMPVNEYQYRTGKPPEVGAPFMIDPAVPGRVETVTKEEAVVRFSAEPGAVVQTPFGPGRIRESEKAYEIVIDAKKSDLVRTGPFVGRISEVDDESITIDYRHPFGGETLDCDVAVEKVTKIKQAKSGTGE